VTRAGVNGRDRGHGWKWSHGLHFRLMTTCMGHSLIVVCMLALTTTTAAGCRRPPAVPEAVYRQAVTAFYVSLAAMQTSQDVLARKELEHLIQLVPGEAAGWANLGLLFLRQQQFDEAADPLAKASALAPQNAAIERLRALTESEAGEPLVRFVTLRNPEPQPASADEQLTFEVNEQPALSLPGATWASAIWLTADAPPAVAFASPRELRLSTGTVVGLSTEVAPPAPGSIAVAAADLNYDFRTDLVVASGRGVQILRQNESARFSSVTADAKLPADLATAPMLGVWPADLDTDGDLDLVLARRDGPPAVLRNNGDTTFAAGEKKRV
jgi:FG-GAP-like repeat